MRNKTTAILLVFFLGWLGVHKFYLGQNGAGVLYLLFSWTFIPAIIAIFDFIGLLLISERDFNIRFNSNNMNMYQGFNPGVETSKDKTSTLRDLKELYESGVITAEEYEEKRRKYLDSL